MDTQKDAEIMSSVRLSRLIPLANSIKHQNPYISSDEAYRRANKKLLWEDQMERESNNRWAAEVVQQVEMPEAANFETGEEMPQHFENILDADDEAEVRIHSYAISKLQRNPGITLEEALRLVREDLGAYNDAMSQGHFQAARNIMSEYVPGAEENWMQAAVQDSSQSVSAGAITHPQHQAWAEKTPLAIPPFLGDAGSAFGGAGSSFSLQFPNIGLSDQPSSLEKHSKLMSPIAFAPPQRGFFQADRVIPSQNSNTLQATPNVAPQQQISAHSLWRASFGPLDIEKATPLASAEQLTTLPFHSAAIGKSPSHSEHTFGNRTHGIQNASIQDVEEEEGDHDHDDKKTADDETFEEFKERLMISLEQMMFVSGETAEPSAETTGMIEEIVRQQVIEMLTQATALANRRGVRSISTADLIFLIRHDKAKVSRLKTYLSWKDVRKNVKDSDDKGGADAGDAVDFDDNANLPGTGPADSKKAANKKTKPVLPWEVQSFFSEQVPEREDEEDEEEEEQNEATLVRLATADERTKNMTRDEYVFWSDCRQASFTFRKGKRFREWAGFGVVTDSKPNDDIIDILGFLTFEIVQTLTEEALKVKAAEDLHNARTAGVSGGETKKRKREGGSLFQMPEEGRTPVEPKHVREAFRRLQVIPNKYKFMRQGYAGIRTPLRLI